MREKKKPKWQVEPHPNKQPTATTPTSYHKLNPSWRIAKMEMVDPFGWHQVDSAMLSYIRDRIIEFERRTWAEILGDHHNHPVEVGRLAPLAQERLQEMRQDDLEEMLSLRLSGKERIWGILDRGVCTLIWWDPEHQVCPSQKKNA